MVRRLIGGRWISVVLQGRSSGPFFGGRGRTRVRMLRLRHVDWGEVSPCSWFDCFLVHLFLRSLRPEVHGRLKLHRDSHTGIAGVGASGGLPYMTFIMFNNYNY